MFDKLEDLLIRFEEIMGELNEPTVTNNQARFRKLMKEQSDLTPIVDAYKEYKKSRQDIEDSLMMLINSYTTGLSASVMEYILGAVIKKKFGGNVKSSEIGLPVTETGMILPCGASAIWEKNGDANE